MSEGRAATGKKKRTRPSALCKASAAGPRPGNDQKEDSTKHYRTEGVTTKVSTDCFLTLFFRVIEYDVSPLIEEPYVSCTPGRARTCNPMIRSHILGTQRGRLRERRICEPKTSALSAKQNKIRINGVFGRDTPIFVP